jgi:hypothetical protein
MGQPDDQSIGRLRIGELEPGIGIPNSLRGAYN